MARFIDKMVKPHGEILILKCKGEIHRLDGKVTWSKS